MPFLCYVLDSTGTAQNSVTVHTINAGTGNRAIVPVSSALVGTRGVSLSPQGAFIDKVPQFSFQVPLSVWKNAAAAPGAQIVVVDTDLPGGVANAVTQGPVATKGVAVSPDGESATITCDDLLYDLVRADVGSGYASATGETTTGTLLRLIGPDAAPRLVDTTWAVVNDVAGLDGIPFASAPATVLTAVDALRVQRFAHWTRSGTRTLHFFSESAPFLENASPMRLQKAGAGQTSDRVAGIRVIKTVSFSTDAHVQNAITPVGGGSGISELTLRVLYGDTTFTGYDAARPILRRPRADGGGFDGLDYYIEAAGSVATWGRTHFRLSKTEIAPVVSTTGGVSAVDERAAAIALYSVGLSELKRRRQPRTVLQIATDGWGDFRGAGGQTVRVRYQGVAWDQQGKQTVTINVDDDYTVLDCVVAEGDDGTRTATWTLSSDGEGLSGAGSFVAGVAGTLAALQGATPTAFLPISKQKSMPIGPGAPLRLTIYPDNGMVRQHYMDLYVSLEGVRHTRADNGHTQDVVTGAMNHDVATLPIGGTVPASTSQGGGFAADIAIATTEPPGGDTAITGKILNGVLALFHVGGGTIRTSSSLTTTTTSHTHPIPALTVTGQVPATTGGAGGTVLQKTHTAAAGLGAKKAFATVEDVYEGPLPTGVTVWVNNVQVGGPYNGTVPVLDLNPYTSGQGRYDIEVRAATPGNADVSLEGLRDRAGLAIKPVG